MSEISVLENSKMLILEASNMCSARCLDALKYGRHEKLELLSPELSEVNAAIDGINSKIHALPPDIKKH